jgi:Na+/proline symporter
VSQHVVVLAPEGCVSTAVWAALGALLALKLLAATVALRALRRRGQVARRAFAPLIASWLLVVLALAAALAGIARLAPRPGGLEDLIRRTYLPFLHPANLPPACHEPLVRLLFALPFLPLARLAAAPIVLGWNRRW